jgi:mono/diheme cytochrome c family protein/ketosteroid isomerase-like protein
MKTLLRSALALAAVVAAVALYIVSGAYDVAADQGHTAIVRSLIEFGRDRSIARRAANIEVPPLDDAQGVRRGAGNYDAMCAGCHRAPGVEQSEIARGLYPAPPNFAAASGLDPARTFWIIKHGIKATGMPAWGRSVDDRSIWDLVRFMRALPGMSAERYAAEVQASGGHSHGAAEDMEDHHGAGGEGNQSHSGDAHTHEKTPLGSDVQSAVRRFHEALSSGNAAAVEAVLDPDVLIMESGNVERSRDEYASHHLKADIQFMRAMKYTLERQQGETVGDLAWVSSEASLAGQFQGRSVTQASTESLVLRKTGAGWRIVHVHWSSRG